MYDPPSNYSVSVKRLISSALVVLVGFGVQVAYGAPTRSTQTIGALWCCSTRCDHAKSPAAAAHCCGVAGGGSELTASPQTKVPEGGPTTTQTLFVELDVASGLDGHFSAWAGTAPAARGRAAPLFLLTRSLRI